MARLSAAMDVEDFILNGDLDVWQVFFRGNCWILAKRGYKDELE